MSMSGMSKEFIRNAPEIPSKDLNPTVRYAILKVEKGKPETHGLPK